MRYKNTTFWLFITHEDHEFQTGIRDHDFKNEWFEISEDGKVLIKGSHVQDNGMGGYAWDGCSPKFAFLDLVIGTPDGVIDEKTEKPKTYYASMVHDALYQFGPGIGIKRLEIDRLFLDMLKGFKLRHIYYFLVRMFGMFYYQK